MNVIEALSDAIPGKTEFVELHRSIDGDTKWRTFRVEQIGKGENGRVTGFLVKQIDPSRNYLAFFESAHEVDPKYFIITKSGKPTDTHTIQDIY